ncbi:hypothetical protein MLD38_033961 [Melastoma candidum]|uniref:Uncharacterized protein n=1 Tax=Melastoma candidum TaxID=119954 RepID=A0ACB9MB17_9MYRT|nr:hypothetical protein MLD38_033961 [Melastoma candidum]
MSEHGHVIKFGILGCAGIARKVSRAITLSPNSALFAVASRSLDKARLFATANGFPPDARLYGSYEALLDDPEVDAVYVPLPTSLHVVWAVAAAEKGKHVLLEKPVALSAGEFDVIVATCERNGVQLMDGTMWMHHPRTAKMKDFLRDGDAFGRFMAIHSCFTFAADPDFLKNDIRVKPDLDSLGALGDVGWYCVRAILWVVDFELPKTVTALQGSVLNDSGVILSCGGSLLWGDGKVATFHCSFMSHLTMDITALGTNGTLHVHDFVIPYQEKEASYTTASGSGFDDLVSCWVPKPSEHLVTTDLPQEALMVKEFSSLVGGIKSRGLKPDTKWPLLSRKTQLILDLVKKSIDNGFMPVEVIG